MTAGVTTKRFVTVIGPGTGRTPVTNNFNEIPSAITDTGDLKTWFGGTPDGNNTYRNTSAEKIYEIRIYHQSTVIDWKTIYDELVTKWNVMVCFGAYLDEPKQW